jgi:hypothetical protein
LFRRSQAAKHFSFRFTEFVLAMFDKDFWDRHSERRSNNLIGIKQSEPRSPLQATSDGRLPCAHHPDQNDRFANAIHGSTSH